MILLVCCVWASLSAGGEERLYNKPVKFKEYRDPLRFFCQMVRNRPYDLLTSNSRKWMHGSRGKPYISHLPAVWEWCWVDPVTKKFILNKSGLKEHPIDALHQKQWDKAKTTTGYAETYPCAYNLWDAELNRVYKGVLNSKTDRPFNPDERQKIVEAQRQWIRFRDAQVKALNAHYSRFWGTIYKLSKGRSKSCKSSDIRPSFCSD